MKYRVFMIVAATLLMCSVVAAQSDCGDGLPCGRIPWDLPALPVLPSPTPMPTVGITLAPPTQTPGGPTATATPTSIPADGGFDIDVSGINDQFATLQGLAGATQSVIEVSGTPVAADEQLGSLAADSYTFFGYVRGIAAVDFGGLTQFIAFIITAFVTVIAVKSITFILPILIALFNFIKGVISVVLDFIPF